jgi:Uncharacterised nucleotidyltransferase
VVIGPIEKSASRWHRMQPLDIRSLEEGSFGLLPLLYERLSVVASDDPSLSLLGGIYRSTWYRNQLALERVAALLAALRDTKVNAVLVGGAALLVRWYPRVGSRPVPLLEVMVAPGAGETAREVAISHGWRPAGRTRLRRRFVDTDGRVLAIHEGAPPQVSGPLGSDRAFEIMHSSAQNRRVLEETALVLAPTDELMFLCGEGARTTLPPTVQWLLDLALLLNSNERPTPHDILARARLFRLASPVRDALVYISEIGELPGLADHVCALVGEPVRRRERVAYHLSGMEVGRFGGLPLVVGAHFRATMNDDLPHSLLTLPAYFVDVWEADSIRQLPALAARKFRRLRRNARVDRQS